MTEITTANDNESGSGPGPRILTDEELTILLSEQQFGVLATVKRSGHPHLSTVLYHWDPDERIVRISTTDDRLKTLRYATTPASPCT